MHIPRILLLTLVMLAWFIPGQAEARTSGTKFLYFDSTFTPNPEVKAATALVPDPKATRVQVYFFKKSALLLPQAMPGLASLPPGTRPVPGVNLVKDPQVAKLIAKYAKQHGVDPRLVQAMVRQESGFNPMAVSPKGAMGLMQLMPETAASMGVEDPFDIEQNIRGGIRFFKSCLNRFDQNLPLALAAYNAGPGRVTEHQGVPPFKETQTYVRKIVLDYCGQDVDPAQIKIGPAPKAKDAAESASPSDQPPVPSPGSPPLNLSFFSPPASGTGEAVQPPDKAEFKKRDQVSIY